MRRILSTIFATLMLSSLTASAQLNLVKNRKAKARIVCTDNNDTNLQAANLLNHFLELISGTTLPVVQGSPTDKNAIILGEQTTKASHDGFEFATDNGSLHIKNGGHKGTIYGIVTLLEKYIGVNYWANNSYTLHKQNNITLPIINYAESPAFRYRQTFSYGTTTQYTNCGSVLMNQTKCSLIICGYTHSTRFCLPTDSARHTQNGTLS